MKITKTITINKSPEEVWAVLADDFANAYKWMAQVPYSHEIEEGETADDSPMIGRVCELSTRPDGPKADERITYYNKEEKEVHVLIRPFDAKLPIVKNELQVRLKAVGNNSTLVDWDANLELKTAGKLLYPALKLGIAISFAEVLEELKYYLEEGKPHPRKVAKIKKETQAA